MLFWKKWKTDPGGPPVGYDPVPAYSRHEFEENAKGFSWYTDARETYAPYGIAWAIRTYRALRDRATMALYWWGFLDVEDGAAITWRRLTLRAGRTNKKRVAAALKGRREVWP